jgi:hypothetical protein
MIILSDMNFYKASWPRVGRWSKTVKARPQVTLTA